MALATIDDFINRLGRLPSDAEFLRAEALLEDASASVVLYTGQSFERATTTTRLRVRNGRLRLPQRPVNSVDSVADVNGNTVSFTWDGADVVCVASNLDSFGWEPWASPINAVDVTYDHGYDEIPPGVVAVVCQIAARALGRPPDTTGIQQEAIAGYSYTVGAAAAAGAAGMMTDERAVLDRYRRVGGTAWVSP